MSKKLMNKLIAIALCMILCFAMTGTALAADSAVKPIDNLSKITVHLYNGNPGTPGNGAAADPSGTPVKGAALKYMKIGTLVQYSSGNKTELLYQIPKDGLLNQVLGIDGIDIDSYATDQYYYVVPDSMQNNLSNKTGSSSIITFIAELKTAMTDSGSITAATDAAGAATVSDAKGLYLFVGETMPSSVHSLLTPFLVSAPMPDTDGTGWNTDIQVYPKVGESEITMTKTAAQGGAAGSNGIIAESGTPVNYAVEITIPGHQGTAAGFETFTVSDKYPAGLTIADDPALTIGTDTLKKDSDYTLSNDTKNRTLTLTLTESGKKKLNADSTVAATVGIAYKGILGPDAVLGITGNKNTAELTYQRSGGSQGTVAASAAVHTYGIKLTKTLSDGAAIKDGEIAFTLTKQGSSEAISMAKETESGEYWADGTSSTTEMTVPGNAEEGVLYMKGLAPGTYELKETKTMKGYSKLDKPVEIVIKPPEGSLNVKDITAVVDGRNGTISSGEVELKIVNTAGATGFTLPLTGGAGTIAILIAGFALICAAVVMLVVYRRRHA